MAKPYVYLLINHATGQFYFGYRQANTLPAMDDLRQYKTSSTSVKEIGFENFSTYLVKEFDDPVHAYDLEQLLISLNFDSDEILNQQFRLGEKVRFKTPDKLPDEWREKLREAAYKRSPITDETRNKLRKAKLGRKRGPESTQTTIKRITTRENNSNTIWVITSPSGKVIKTKNLSAFCKANGLSAQHMSSVAAGRRTHHRNFTVRKELSSSSDLAID